MPVSPRPASKFLHITIFHANYAYLYDFNTCALYMGQITVLILVLILNFCPASVPDRQCFRIYYPLNLAVIV
jgi:hypothetical protein